MADETLLTIPKSDSEELRLQISDYKGRRFLNLRVWFSAGEGAMRPGKQGVTVPLRAIPELRQALAEAEAIARRNGLMPEAPRAGPPH